MQHLFDFLFTPPPMPPIDLPMAARLIPGAKVAIAQAFSAAYYRGLYDGAIAGVLFTLLLMPSMRKGASDASKHF